MRIASRDPLQHQRPHKDSISRHHPLCKNINKFLISLSVDNLPKGCLYHSQIEKSACSFHRLEVRRKGQTSTVSFRKFRKPNSLICWQNSETENRRSQRSLTAGAGKLLLNFYVGFTFYSVFLTGEIKCALLSFSEEFKAHAHGFMILIDALRASQ